MNHDIQSFLLLLTLTLMNILIIRTIYCSYVLTFVSNCNDSNKHLHPVKLRTVEEIIEKYVINPQSNNNLTYNVVQL